MGGVPQQGSGRGFRGGGGVPYILAPAWHVALARPAWYHINNLHKYIYICMIYIYMPIYIYIHFLIYLYYLLTYLSIQYIYIYIYSIRLYHIVFIHASETATDPPTFKRLVYPGLAFGFEVPRGEHMHIGSRFHSQFLATLQSCTPKDDSSTMTLISV